MTCNKDDLKTILNQLLFSRNTTCITDRFLWKYTYFIPVKRSILKENITFSSRVPCVLHLYTVSVAPSTMSGHAKKENSPWKIKLTKNIYRWASKRVIKTWLYKRYIFTFETMNAGEESFPCCMKIYHKFHHCSLYTHQQLPLHCIHNLQLNNVDDQPRKTEQ